MSLAAFVNAATYTETFNGLTGGGASAITGSPSLSGFNFAYDQTSPRSTINTTDYMASLSGNTKCLDTNGSVYDWLQFNGGNIPSATGNIIQFAIPIKVVSLGSSKSSCSVDIFSLETTSGSYSPCFAIRANQGIFRTTDDNGWPGVASPISDVAFDPASGLNWRDSEGGRWHVVAFRIKPSTTSGAGSYIVYDINPTNGQVTTLQNYTGATNTVVTSGIPRLAAGLCVGSAPVSDANTRILIDDVTFWDDAFATDNDFANAVKSKYQTPVSDWAVMK